MTTLPGGGQKAHAWAGLSEPNIASIGWTGALMLAVVVEHGTIIDAPSLTLTWPTAGVATAWWFSTRRRERRTAAILILLSTVIAGLATGAPTGLTVIVAIANLLLAIVIDLVLRSLVRHDLDDATTWELDSAGHLLALGVAVIVGGVVATAYVGAAARLMGHPWVWVDAMASATGRSTAALMLVVLARLLRSELRRPVATSAWRWQVRRLALFLAERGLELTAVLAAMVLAYLVVFVWSADVPVSFLLLIPTVWAGMRFGPFPVHLLSLVGATTTVVFTMVGAGPVAQIDDAGQKIMVAQAFIGLSAIVALFLSLVRQERYELHQRLAEALRRDQQRARLLSTVVDSIHDGVGLVGSVGNVILANPAAKRLLGVTDGAWPAGGIRGFQVRDPDGEPLPAAEVPFVRAFQTGLPAVEDLLITPRDGGDERLLEIRLVPVGAAGPETASDLAVVVIRDVAEERAQFDALQSFAGIAAHDLKTPLTLIMGWSELADDELHEPEPDLDRLGAFVRQINSAGASMGMLIGDLLALSAAQDSALRLAETDLREIVHEIVEGYHDRIDPTPTFIVGEIPPVLGDPGLLRPLMANLISNAVKYVEPGAAAKVRVSGRTRADGWIEVAVSDRGIGIPEDQRHQVFRAFRRAHAADYPGHGLGLSICRRIVERHGGTIQASTNPDRVGTRIVFRLPNPDRE